MASAGGRAYGSLQGAVPHRAPKAEPLVSGSGAKPHKAENFLAFSS